VAQGVSLTRVHHRAGQPQSAVRSAECGDACAGRGPCDNGGGGGGKR
jgi:hypothetical protein